MKIDYDYIKKICDVFLESETECVNAFSSLNPEEEKFVSHIKIMAEKQLISNVMGNSSFEGLGFSQDLSQGNVHYTYPKRLWRLTANGHDFASALNKPDVLSTLKEKFKDEGISSVMDIAKQLAQKYLEKKLESL
jgi:hypothetical protein